MKYDYSRLADALEHLANALEAVVEQIPCDTESEPVQEPAQLELSAEPTKNPTKINKMYLNYGIFPVFEQKCLENGFTKGFICQCTGHKHGWLQSRMSGKLPLSIRDRSELANALFPGTELSELFSR